RWRERGLALAHVTEVADGLPERAAELADLARPEHDEGDAEDDDEVPRFECAHGRSLRPDQPDQGSSKSPVASIDRSLLEQVIAYRPGPVTAPSPGARYLPTAWPAAA